jgi:REP element-mobilizing transposase RayT
MNPDKYQDKYRIASARLAGWDYGSNAAYFITICTQDRVHAFGEVIDGQVSLSPLGQAAWDCWNAIPEHFPFVVLDGFVAMPNHVHGIVVIDKPAPNLGDRNDHNDGDDVGNDGNVETQNFASLRPPRPRRSVNQFGPQSQNLASIVRGFKIGVTKYARQHQIPFAWQPRYHDHIIRNAAEHERIRKYIIENPQKWAADCFYESK